MQLALVIVVCCGHAVENDKECSNMNETNDFNSKIYIYCSGDCIQRPDQDQL